MPQATRSPRRDNLPLAIGTILFSVFALSLGDALIKRLGGDFVLWQIFVLRAALAVPVLMVAIALLRPVALAFATPLWTALRSAMLVLMWVLYYLALPHIPLSVAAAGFYTLPLFITLFSALFLSDRIAPVGWMAVAMGFAGVVMILRPEAGDFSLYALLPLISAMLYAGAMLLTRSKCRAEPPLMLALALNLGFLAVGLLATLLLWPFDADLRQGSLLASWSPMAARDWASMGLLAVSVLIGSIGAAIAYQKARPALVGSIDFAYVGFAALWGVWLFGEALDRITVTGIALIVAAGLLSLRAARN
jgi:drug/metabolite transporter (DMT)-like permease